MVVDVLINYYQHSTLSVPGGTGRHPATIAEQAWRCDRVSSPVRDVKARGRGTGRKHQRRDCRDNRGWPGSQSRGGHFGAKYQESYYE